MVNARGPHRSPEEGRNSTPEADRQELPRGQKILNLLGLDALGDVELEYPDPSNKGGFITVQGSRFDEECSGDRAKMMLDMAANAYDYEQITGTPHELKEQITAMLTPNVMKAGAKYFDDEARLTL